MNKQRRKAIDAIIDKLDELRADLEDLKTQEEEAFDSFPENLKYSEKGERIENCIGLLEDALTNVENAQDNCREAIEG